MFEKKATERQLIAHSKTDWDDHSYLRSEMWSLEERLRAIEKVTKFPCGCDRYAGDACDECFSPPDAKEPKEG